MLFPTFRARAPGMGGCLAPPFYAYSRGLEADITAIVNPPHRRRDPRLDLAGREDERPVREQQE